MAEATKEEEEEEAVKVPGSIPRAAYEQTALLLLRPLAVRSRSRCRRVPTFKYPYLPGTRAGSDKLLLVRMISRGQRSKPAEYGRARKEEEEEEDVNAVSLVKLH